MSNEPISAVVADQEIKMHELGKLVYVQFTKEEADALNDWLTLSHAVPSKIFAAIKAEPAGEFEKGTTRRMYSRLPGNVMSAENEAISQAFWKIEIAKRRLVEREYADQEKVVVMSEMDADQQRHIWGTVKKP